MNRSERILVIDKGNTLVKMTLFEGSDPVGNWTRETAAHEELLSLCAAMRCEGGIFSSVGKINTRFVESLRMMIGENFMIFTPRTPLPIGNCYSTPQTLGADRLAAAVGAWSFEPEKDLMIVDAGTAITSDYLSFRDGFRGGAISPGVRMRLESLARLTARLPFVEPDTAPLVGTSTEESLLTGAVAGALLEIKGRAELLGLKEEQIFLTGGDAPLLRSEMKRLGIMDKIRFEPDLLVRGLLEIYRFNLQLSHDFAN